MGGRASSSTSSATTDARVGADNGALGVSVTGDGSSVIVTADEAWELGYQAIEALANAADASLKIVGGSQDILATALDGQTAANKSEAGQIGEQLVRIGLPVVAIAAVAYMVMK